MKTVGVIVGRFQTPYLHDGHRSLIESVRSRHEKVFIVLGCSRAMLTRSNPLDSQTRYEMLQHTYPSFRVNLLWDSPSDELWSKELDLLIDSKFPEHTPILYGNRDSFLKHYTGKYEYRKLPETVVMSATELRDEIVKPLPSEDFRRGMIYASRIRYPAVFPTVDIALYDQGRVLLGRKKQDNGLWRFPGGFVDPKDRDFLSAAKRELGEEVGMMETSDWRYVTTERIDDYRYPAGADDKIMTTLFYAKYLWGAPIATDDLDEVSWHACDAFSLPNPEKLVPVHRQLLPALARFWKGTK